MTIDEIYLSEAIKQARAGAKRREEPVGAVVVMGSRVVGRAHQQTRSLRDPTAHAVMIALTQAAEAYDNGKLKRAVLYVTEAPCRMCLAAAQHAGVRRITYGVKRKVPTFPRIKMVGGVLKVECVALRQHDSDRGDRSRGKG